MPRKKRLTKTERNKRFRRILLIVGVIIAIPILVYGARIYNLYNTMHEPLDEEEFEAFDPTEVTDDENDEDENDKNENDEDEKDVDEVEVDPTPEDIVKNYQDTDDAF